MPRFQVHLTVYDDRHAEADPVLIAVVNAEDDEAALEAAKKLLPVDLEYDMTEVCCDGCSMPVGICECVEAA